MKPINFNGFKMSYIEVALTVLTSVALMVVVLLHFNQKELTQPTN